MALTLSGIAMLARLSQWPNAESPMVARVPAMKDPKADMPSAAPALPFRAIWYPSMHVTTEVASPGILSSIEVVEPPY